MKKANRILAIIKRSFTFLNRNIFRKLYKALVRPIVEYGNVVWATSFVGDRKKIEGVQRRATKLVRELRDLPYQERIKNLNLPSLSFRRKRGDMITLYKMINGLMKTEGIIQIPERRHQTRGHHLRLVKQHAVKRVRRNHLTIRSLDTWNNLPEQVVTSRNLNLFKRNLDKIWADGQFGLE